MLLFIWRDKCLQIVSSMEEIICGRKCLLMRSILWTSLVINIFIFSQCFRFGIPTATRKDAAIKTYFWHERIFGIPIKPLLITKSFDPLRFSSVLVHYYAINLWWLLIKQTVSLLNKRQLAVMGLNLLFLNWIQAKTLDPKMYPTSKWIMFLKYYWKQGQKRSF